MILTFSAPSKTFLVGEYAVLSHAPALVINTSPRFELVAERDEMADVRSLFPAGSPAALLLQDKRALLDGWRLEFRDPHQFAGGFGASSAQFIFVHCLLNYLQSSFAKITEVFDKKSVWSDHQRLTEYRGSGADVLAQIQGEIALVNVEGPDSKSLTWPYSELGFGIVRTHQKIKTHEHLRQIDHKEMTFLVRPAQACVEAFMGAGAEVFVSRLKAFSNALKEFELQAPAALTLIRWFDDQPWCLAAKGCGALGADTVLFLYPMEEKEKVMHALKKQSLNLVATQAQISTGLELNLRV